MKRVYISGPMTGVAGLNFPAFHAASEQLRNAGVEVVNPAELPVDPNAGWHECMKACIRELCGCDTIVLLPGWMNSQGAHLELNIAHRIGLRILTFFEAMQRLNDEVRAMA